METGLSFSEFESESTLFLFVYNFLPIPDAESLPFYPLVLKLVVCVKIPINSRQQYTYRRSHWCTGTGHRIQVHRIAHVHRIQDSDSTGHDAAHMHGKLNREL